MNQIGAEPEYHLGGYSGKSWWGPILGNLQVPMDNDSTTSLN